MVGVWSSEWAVAVATDQRGQHVNVNLILELPNPESCWATGKPQSSGFGVEKEPRVMDLLNSSAPGRGNPGGCGACHQRVPRGGTKPTLSDRSTLCHLSWKGKLGRAPPSRKRENPHSCQLTVLLTELLHDPGLPGSASRSGMILQVSLNLAMITVPSMHSSVSLHLVLLLLFSFKEPVGRKKLGTVSFVALEN